MGLHPQHLTAARSRDDPGPLTDEGASTAEHCSVLKRVSPRPLQREPCRHRAEREQRWPPPVGSHLRGLPRQQARRRGAGEAGSRQVGGGGRRAMSGGLFWGDTGLLGCDASDLMAAHSTNAGETPEACERASPAGGESRLRAGQKARRDRGRRSGACDCGCVGSCRGTSPGPARHQVWPHEQVLPRSRGPASAFAPTRHEGAPGPRLRSLRGARQTRDGGTQA